MRPDRPGILACPHCALPLDLDERGARCASGHGFDRARQGYLNLLVGGRIASQKVPGDAPESLAARRRFFAGGHYAPIADAVAAAVGSPTGAVLDIGCGEGFYLDRIAAPHRCGLDISKTAVRMSAGLVRDGLFFVASSYRMPVLAGSVDTVVSVFSPRPADEVARVLRPGGRFVTAAPGPGHLTELAPPAVSESPADLRRRARAERRETSPSSGQAERLRFTLDLDEAGVRDLVQMTPLAWHGHAHQAIAAGVRRVSVDVWIATVEVADLRRVIAE